MPKLNHNEADSLLRTSLNREVLDDFHQFLIKVNERNLFVRGLIDRYDPPNEALGETVEYFSPQITMDDRMVYIMKHIVTSPSLSMFNKIGNTTISHFYGARGIHSVLTGDDNPDTAHVNFELLALEQKTGDLDYTYEMRKKAAQAKRDGVPMWGTTELHTSIQDAGNKFVKGRHGEEHLSPFAVAEWIASWINTGFMKGLTEIKSLKGMFLALRSQRGIGPYYGYHCATSNSVNPSLPFNHDEDFCSPGPGAVMTLEQLFGDGLKQVDPGEAVIWFRKNQDELLPGLRNHWHPETANVTANGITVFSESQCEMKTYGTEVGLCQYSVYCRLRDNPELISRRKVARIETKREDTGLSSFFE